MLPVTASGRVRSQPRATVRSRPATQQPHIAYLPFLSRHNLLWCPGRHNVCPPPSCKPVAGGGQGHGQNQGVQKAAPGKNGLLPHHRQQVRGTRTDVAGVFRTQIRLYHHPHVHALVPAGIMKGGVFHELTRISSPVIAGLFRARLLKVLLDEGVIRQQIVDLLLSPARKGAPENSRLGPCRLRIRAKTLRSTRNGPFRRSVLRSSTSGDALTGPFRSAERLPGILIFLLTIDFSL